MSSPTISRGKVATTVNIQLPRMPCVAAFVFKSQDHCVMVVELPRLDQSDMRLICDGEADSLKLHKTSIAYHASP
jgi:hypothetical protein